MKHPRENPQAGFTLIDVLVASSIATFMAGGFLMLQLAVSQGVAGINQHSTFQTTLAQATDQILQDFSSARGAVSSWNGMSADQDSTGDGVARWILEVPDPTSTAVAHVVYEYLGASTNPPYQLTRKYYAPGSTTLTNTRVVANAVGVVRFEDCPYNPGGAQTTCVQPIITMRSNRALPGYQPTLRVRATYCNAAS